MKTAVVEIIKAPRQVKTRYGDRVVFDIEFIDGEQETIWCEDDKEHQFLLDFDQGDEIAVVIDKKGKSHPLTPTAQQSRASEEPQGAGKRQEMETYIGAMLRLYWFIWEQACQQFDGLSEDSIRSIATSVFIATQRKFDS